MWEGIDLEAAGEAHRMLEWLCLPDNKHIARSMRVRALGHMRAWAHVYVC